MNDEQRHQEWVAKRKAEKANRRERAAECLKDHEYTVLADTDQLKAWRCKAPRTSAYAFDILITRFGIAIVGDIDGLTFSVGPSYGIEFLAGDDIGYYIHSKLEERCREREFDEQARGKKSGNPEHDASRSTAWAPISALEFHRPQAAVIENVPEFTDWVLYPAWLQAVQALGYQVAPHIVDCADLGVPQHRVRLFVVLTRSRAPLMLQLQREQHVPAASFLNFEAGRWSLIEKPGRAQATLDRVRNGRQRFGDRFIMPYYGKGSGTTGRDINRPIGTITTLDRWALVDGVRMRMLSANEALAAMSFPADTRRPDNHRLTMHMAGNAVPPLAGQRVIEALMAAA